MQSPRQPARNSFDRGCDAFKFAFPDVAAHDGSGPHDQLGLFGQLRRERLASLLFCRRRPPNNQRVRGWRLVWNDIERQVPNILRRQVTPRDHSPSARLCDA